MAEYEDREAYIPLQRSDLVQLLIDDSDLSDDEKRRFRDFCRLVSAIYHFHFHEKLEEIKTLYAPFNPDRTTRPLRELSDEERQQRLDRLFEVIGWIMERGNFIRLSKKQLEEATEICSYWGVNLDIDFDAFEKLEVYVRGDIYGTRFRRVWWKLWREQEEIVDIYQRLILVLKLKDDARFGREIDTKSVIIKMFKDIPKADMEMLLPGGKVKMPKFEKGKLLLSVLGTVGFIGYKLLHEFASIVHGIMTHNPLFFWGPISLIAGYGYRQWAGYQSSRMAYHLQLAQSLYFQTLGSNAGVLTHLFDEAEDQEFREVVLAYWCLWRHAPECGWTARDLDDYVELELHRLADLKVDFEIDDALRKLESLGLVQKQGEHYCALTLDRALERLDHTWDNFFQYCHSLL